MKNFFETVKEFFAEHFKQVTFVIFVTVGTIIALLTNYAHNHGYGDSWRSGEEHHSRHYYSKDRHDNAVSNRKPWKFEKPSSKPSSSHSSGRK